jgi:hypothetical protein
LCLNVGGVVHDNIRPQEAYEFFLELRDQNNSERTQ